MNITNKNINNISASSWMVLTSVFEVYSQILSEKEIPIYEENKCVEINAKFSDLNVNSKHTMSSVFVTKKF